jgi:hypothetical protein
LFLICFLHVSALFFNIHRFVMCCRSHAMCCRSHARLQRLCRQTAKSLFNSRARLQSLCRVSTCVVTCRVRVQSSCQFQHPSAPLLACRAPTHCAGVCVRMLCDYVSGFNSLRTLQHVVNLVALGIRMPRLGRRQAETGLCLILLKPVFEMAQTGL